MLELSILVRCSDDVRVFSCLDSIDEDCDIVVALTPSDEIERGVTSRGIRTATTPRGNPAVTTIAALPLCRYSTIMLVDSDCVFLPGAIRRVFELARYADIVRPEVEFEASDWSSSLTRLAREFQYTYNGHIYEPGLLIRVDNVVPAVGGYLFTEWAPFTPDGEFDERARNARLRVLTDPEPTLVHTALSFPRHLHSHWRYGLSEAMRHVVLGHSVLSPFLSHLPSRYRVAVSDQYPGWTFAAIVVTDFIYIASMAYHLVRLRGRYPRSAPAPLANSASVPSGDTVSGSAYMGVESS